MSMVLIACGGTGGHLAPGIALAETLQERGHQCLLLISQKDVDTILIEKYRHLNFYRMPGQAFSGGFSAIFRSLMSLLSGFVLAYKLIREQEPDAVMLFGGFLSAGLGLAARLMGVQVVLHEANCKPGKAIRMLKYMADRIYLPDGVKLAGAPINVVRHFGYPVRKEVKHILKADAWLRLDIKVPNKLLVVIGGSQGAEALNEWVMSSFERLAKAGITVYCVTGLGKLTAGTIACENINGDQITATMVPFSSRMGDVISAADLVVSRAGAGSIAEIICCRAPAILIPYPHAADNHQQANALIHEQHGAGIVLDQKNIGQLTDEVEQLMFNDWLLNNFKSNLDRLDRFNSSERIAADIEVICEDTVQKKECVHI